VNVNVNDDGNALTTGGIAAIAGVSALGPALVAEYQRGKSAILSYRTYYAILTYCPEFQICN
jgi:hypothetical protein